MILNDIGEVPAVKGNLKKCIASHIETVFEGNVANASEVNMFNLSSDRRFLAFVDAMSETFCIAPDVFVMKYSRQGYREMHVWEHWDSCG